MKRLILHLLVLSVLCLLPKQSCHAQDAKGNVVVTGTVMDKTDNEAVPYATVSVSFIEDGKEQLYGQVCDGRGLFRISIPYKETYYIDVSYVGKKFEKRTIHPEKGEKVITLTDIFLQDDESTNLDELKVVHKRALIKMDIDRMSYAMNEDAEAKKKNLFEMLRKVPLVTVDGKGNIQVKGSGSYKILLNGKPSPIADQDPKMILKSIPASTVKKVEVITEPGVKYDSEGVDAVINIVTDQTTGDGIMGNVSLDFGLPLSLSSSLYLAMKKGKFGMNLVFSGNAGSQGTSYTVSDYKNFVADTRLHQDYESKNKYLGGFGNILLSYEIDTLNLITLSSSFSPYYFKNNSNSKIDDYKQDILLSSKLNQNKSASVMGSVNTSLDYQHSTKREGELLTASYRLNYTPNNSDDKQIRIGELSDGRDYKTWGKSDAYMQEHTMQLDYVLPLQDKHQIESGLKYIYRLSHSDPVYKEFDYGINDWKPIDNGTNPLNNTLFKQYYQIFTVYSAYTYKLKSFSAKAGLRAEWGRSKVEYEKVHSANFRKNHFDWIPEVRLSFRPGMSQQLTLSYGFRVRRPSIGQLNPYVTVLSPYLTMEGNPDLNPTKVHSITLNYSLFTSKVQLYLTPSFTFSNNAIESYYKVDDQNSNMQHYKYDNIGKTRSYAINAYLSWSPWSWMRYSLGGNVNYSVYNSSLVEDKVKSVNAYLYSGLYFNLPKDWSFEINGGLYSPGKGLQTEGKVTYSDNYMVSKSFNDDLWSIDFSVQSPFTKYRKSRTTTTTSISEKIQEQRYLARTFSIGITFNFGHLDSAVKRTERSINNDDLSGGDGGGKPVK